MFFAAIVCFNFDNIIIKTMIKDNYRCNTIDVNIVCEMKFGWFVLRMPTLCLAIGICKSFTERIYQFFDEIIIDLSVFWFWIVVNNPVVKIICMHQYPDSVINSLWEKLENMKNLYRSAT